jgi:hypothetical protein
MMVAARTSETSVNFYQTTRHNNPEDSHLQTITHLIITWTQCYIPFGLEEEGINQQIRDTFIAHLQITVAVLVTYWIFFSINTHLHVCDEKEDSANYKLRFRGT